MGPIGLLAVAVLAVNAALLLVAWRDRSWGAFGIATIYGPVANGILCLLALVCIPLARRAAAGGSVSRYVLCALFLPLIAAVVDLFSIFAMGLHGC